MRYEDTDLSRSIVCFGSFQDYLGTNESGGIKEKNEWIHTTNWDIVIFVEYHFGAWRDNVKSSLKRAMRTRIITIEEKVLRIKKNPDRPGICPLCLDFPVLRHFFDRKIKKYGSLLYHGLPRFVANASNFDRNPLRGCNYGLEGGAV